MRKPPSEAVETEILFASRQRCALCFGLFGDLTTKRGQIAHVDRDSSKSEVEDLCYLCLPHHDEYDSKTSQSKRFTSAELRRQRDGLYTHIKSGQPLVEVSSEDTFSVVGNGMTRGQLDVASLHVANTNREAEIAALRKQLGRRLSAEQKEILRRHLEPLPKRWNATHPSYAAWLGIAVHAASGSDSDDYKADFEDLFRSISFHLGRFAMLTDGEALDGRERYGVWIRWNSEQESLPVGQTLVNALRRCDIDVTPLDLSDASFVELIIYRRRPEPDYAMNSTL